MAAVTLLPRFRQAGPLLLVLLILPCNSSFDFVGLWEGIDPLDGAKVQRSITLSGPVENSRYAITGRNDFSHICTGDMVDNSPLEDADAMVPATLNGYGEVINNASAGIDIIIASMSLICSGEELARIGHMRVTYLPKQGSDGNFVHLSEIQTFRTASPIYLFRVSASVISADPGENTSVTPRDEPPSSAPIIMPTTSPSDVSTKSSSTLEPSITTTTPSIRQSAELSATPSTTRANPLSAPASAILPTRPPTFLPSQRPSVRPTSGPSNRPTGPPSTVPSHWPLNAPSVVPSSAPTRPPSNRPSQRPTQPPSQRPTKRASRRRRPNRRPTTRRPEEPLQTFGGTAVVASSGAAALTRSSSIRQSTLIVVVVVLLS